MTFIDKIRKHLVDFKIREMSPEEYYLLDDFLYEAIFVPDGVEPPDRSIINSAPLQVYVEGFGSQKDDICYIAQVDNKIVGAVWVRIMNDYGHISDTTPSFAISIYKDYRGLGIGTQLMNTMITELKKRGYRQGSLAVQKANYAVRLYQNVGFEIVDENEEEYIMAIQL